MRTLIRNKVSPKLMVALLAAASFVITPALSQADGDKDHKKAEHKMKKHDDDMKKMSHDAKEKAEKKEHEEKHEKHEDESDD
ncbi:hypothetical protein MNBD_ALPHA02-1358 [hydrothermal vent metagenome]|uniref:Uncharacterized protein n=1 Tax=hydrothermal vent metagenome TaxID=652676 RepID=A0A3B0RV37_9ZZZZ